MGKRLSELVRDEATSLDTIADYLEDLSHEARLGEVRALSRREQRLLFARADGDHVALSDFVPDDRRPLEPVRHFGCNTLPIPGQRFFSKRFCRPENDGQLLFGYNDAPSRFLVGPGYFVAIPAEGHPGWPEKGAVVLDYFQVPDGPVAVGWPRIVPNSHGLQFFVYNKTRDFMRRVSNHVTIGAVHKGDRSLGQHFILVREH